MAERIEKSYIRPISISENPDGRGCIVCGEFHPLTGQPVCSLNRTTKRVPLPMSTEKILEYNDFTLNRGLPTVINEDQTTVVIFNTDNIETDLFNQPADLFLEATEERYLIDEQTTPLTNNTQLSLALVELRRTAANEFGLQAVRIKPYRQETRVLFEQQPKIKMF